MLKTGTAVTFRSGAPGSFWWFTIGVDQTGQVSVSDVLPPPGIRYDGNIPGTVMADVQSAIEQVKSSMASVTSGTIPFAGESIKSVVFATSMPGTSYRVYCEFPELVSYAIVSKTRSGFSVRVSAGFTGLCRYDVFN